MLRMESHHSDTSLNFSDRASSSWAKLWNAASYNSPGGLNLGENGSETDLTSAIGDKEVAAKAVAFVVSSTRKGIVPLCADVANLLRNKRSLEDRILQLTKENEALRLRSDRDSLTGSTVTHSKQSEPLDGYPEELSHSACESPPLSPTSPTNIPPSSLSRHKPHKAQVKDTSNSTTFNHTTVPPKHSFVPVSPAVRRSSPLTNSDVIIHPVPSEDASPCNANSNITVAEVHASSEASRRPAGWAAPLRTPSLSSSERGSDRSLEFGSLDDRQSATKLSRVAVRNRELTEQLQAAKATIKKLQREVQDLSSFCKSNNHESADNGIVTLRQGSVPDVLPSPRGLAASDNSLSSNQSCQMCAEARQAANVNGALAPRLFKHDAIKLFTSENMLISLQDSILTSSNQCGTVRYIGHLQGFPATCLFVGLQLADAVNGGLDGTFNGKRYFSCPEGCGMFICAQDIVNVITKKQASVIQRSKKPNVASLHNDESITSSSNSGSTGGFVRKMRRAAANIRHTRSQKRISLPGEAAMTGEQGQSVDEVEVKDSKSVQVIRSKSHSGEDGLPEGFV